MKEFGNHYQLMEGRRGSTTPFSSWGAPSLRLSHPQKEELVDQVEQFVPSSTVNSKYSRAPKWLASEETAAQVSWCNGIRVKRETDALFRSNSMFFGSLLRGMRKQKSFRDQILENTFHSTASTLISWLLCCYHNQVAITGIAMLRQHDLESGLAYLISRLRWSSLFFSLGNGTCIPVSFSYPIALYSCLPSIKV